jgi:uncharacterized RDD family membrane protein YckC
MNYATFWQRFAAMWIDLFVLLPLIFLQTWLESLSKAAAIILVIPMSAAYCAYTVYCHGQFGQTVGKHVMGIRLVRTTGERIGWREAWLRSSVDVAFAILGVISLFVALAAISDAAYYGVGWIRRAKNLDDLKPTWLNWTSVAGQIWIWSEVIVMLFNKRRRALHDFIAGTVVLNEQKVSVPQIQAA